MLALSDGTTRPAEEVTFSDQDTKNLYGMATVYGNAPGANTFLQGYELVGGDVYAYASAYNRLYEQGLTGAVPEKPRVYAKAAVLPREVQNMALEAGKKAGRGEDNNSLVLFEDSKYVSTGEKRRLSPEAELNREEKFADLYYSAIRKRPYESVKIAGNIGCDVSTVKEVWKHVFVNEYLLDGSMKKFASDYQQAQAWQNNKGGEAIKPSDIVFLQHEYLELTLMQQRGLSYDEAHTIVNQKHNWYNLIKESEGLE